MASTYLLLRLADEMFRRGFAEHIGGQFPETGPSEVPRLLDTEMVKVFQDLRLDPFRAW